MILNSRSNAMTKGTQKQKTAQMAPPQTNLIYLLHIERHNTSRCLVVDSKQTEFS